MDIPVVCKEIFNLFPNWLIQSLTSQRRIFLLLTTFFWSYLTIPKTEISTRIRVHNVFHYVDCTRNRVMKSNGSGRQD